MASRLPLLSSSFLCVSVTLCLGAAFPAQAQENEASRVQTVTIDMTPSRQLDNLAMLSYGHLDRSGDGLNSMSNSVNATLVQRLAFARAQYWGIGIGGTNVHVGDNKSDGNFYSLSYGQVWGSPVYAGLSYTLGGYLSYGNSDYETTVNTDEDKKNGAAGIVGGIAQAIPLSSKDMVSVGSNLALSYVVVEDDDDPGAKATLYPFAQYTHSFTPELNAYVRASAAFSTEDVSVSGNKALFTPKIGINYKINDYTLGADYTYEHIDDHRGSRIGLSISRAF